MIAKTLKATLKRASSSVSMEMEIDPPKKLEVGAEAIKDDDFFNAAENGDSSFFEALSHDQLLKALSLRNEDCRSLLHVAASSAHPKVVKILSAADPSVTGINNADEEGWAPFQFAASSGNVEIVEILLSSSWMHPLHRAASTGNSELCELLIEEGAEVDAIDKAGQTPLISVVICENKEWKNNGWREIKISVACKKIRGGYARTIDFNSL
ncbi:poly [ADP-ribose] polymerase tankyrase-like isoform X2 [Camellia sinensis]|uniref:poly [ADP-ribose] polymerase tankyrase-like isoform X2 n=1 Tax=Camellia sinensis TaxID=4442 RepID=UPI001035CE50|nr:poly [ADP-ribose] polymerase tankyrase-like isoform X2 [Camellia sinensis]